MSNVCRKHSNNLQSLSISTANCVSRVVIAVSLARSDKRFPAAAAAARRRAAVQEITRDGGGGGDCFMASYESLVALLYRYDRQLRKRRV